MCDSDQAGSSSETQKCFSTRTWDFHGTLLAVLQPEATAAVTSEGSLAQVPTLTLRIHTQTTPSCDTRCLFILL